MEELRLDYEDFLRQRGLPQWGGEDPRRVGLIASRCVTADEVAEWVGSVHGRSGLYGHNGQSGQGNATSIPSTSSIKSTYPEIAANAALVLIAVASSLLDRQVAALAKAFEKEGGFTERLYRVRTSKRKA